MTQVFNLTSDYFGQVLVWFSSVTWNMLGRTFHTFFNPMTSHIFASDLYCDGIVMIVTTLKH